MGKRIYFIIAVAILILFPSSIYALSSSGCTITDRNGNQITAININETIEYAVVTRNSPPAERVELVVGNKTLGKKVIQKDLGTIQPGSIIKEQFIITLPGQYYIDLSPTNLSCFKEVKVIDPNPPPPAQQSQTNSLTQSSTTTNKSQTPTNQPPKSLNEALKTILGSSPVKADTGITNLGTLVSRALNAVFMLAGLLLFVFLLIGVMQYIFAGGEKEKLGKARTRITQALIGFVIIILSFMISSFVQEVLAPKFPPVTKVTPP